MALEGLYSEDDCENEKSVKNGLTDTKIANRAKQKRVEVEAADLLRLCHTVPLEVVSLGGKGYDPEKADYSDFKAWLQCYYVDGMKSIRDHNGRTMWFKGDPGPLVPNDSKSPKAKKRVKKDDHDYTDKKEVARSRSASTMRKEVVKQETVAKTQKQTKDARSKQAGSKTRRTEVNRPQHNTRATARRRKSSVKPKVAGPQRQSGRITRKNEK